MKSIHTLGAVQPRHYISRSSVLLEQRNTSTSAPEKTRPDPNNSMPSIDGMEEAIVLLLGFLRGKTAAAVQFAIALLRRLQSQAPNAPHIKEAVQSAALRIAASAQSLERVKGFIVFILALTCKNTTAAVQFAAALLRRLRSYVRAAPQRAEAVPFPVLPFATSGSMTATVQGSTAHPLRIVKEVLLFFWRKYVDSTVVLVQLVIALLRRAGRWVSFAPRLLEGAPTAAQHDQAPAPTPGPAQNPSPFLSSSENAAPSPSVSEQTVQCDDSSSLDVSDTSTESPPTLPALRSECDAATEVSRFMLRPTAPSFQPGHAGNLGVPTSPTSPVDPAHGDEDTAVAQESEKRKRVRKRRRSYGDASSRGGRGGSNTRGGRGGSGTRGGRGGHTRGGRGGATTRGGRGGATTRGGRGGASSRRGRGRGGSSDV